MILRNVFCFLFAARKLCGSSAEALYVGVVLKVLLVHLYHKVAIFELELRNCTWRATLVLQSCDFRAGVVLGVPHLCYKVAIFERELRNCTWRATLVLQSCDFRAGVAQLYLACHTCATKLRFLSGSVLHLYYKVAIFELELRNCTSRTTLVPQSCDFRAGASNCTLRTTLVLQSCDFRAGVV